MIRGPAASVLVSGNRTRGRRGAMEGRARECHAPGVSATRLQWRGGTCSERVTARPGPCPATDSVAPRHSTARCSNAGLCSLLLSFLLCLYHPFIFSRLFTLLRMYLLCLSYFYSDQIKEKMTNVQRPRKSIIAVVVNLLSRCVRSVRRN